MRYDLHMRSAFRERVEAVARQMREWEQRPRIDADEESRILEAIRPFQHTTKRADLHVAGVDGSGDFPALSYADSFVYCALAQATLYRSDAASGLAEVGPVANPVFEISWIPENTSRGPALFDAALATLAGQSLESVIEDSDYQALKLQEAGRGIGSVAEALTGLIRPHASDTGNLAIQLRSTAELGAALRALHSPSILNYLLFDGTMSLPFVGRRGNSLFYEHLKRLCCVVARQRGAGFFALSKSHGLPAVERVEELARAKQQLESPATAEHWYMRIPTFDDDGWELSLASGRRLPPPGAVTYLVRFHRTTPVLRLDMDREYWLTHVGGAALDKLEGRESKIFEDLDYACHDQRSYGYPYPIKAGHDRASLTAAERSVLRKQVVEAAVRAGMKRSLFRSASAATGHE